jgi:hypothetical protein
MSLSDYRKITDALPPNEAEVALKAACIERGIDLTEIDIRKDIVVDTIHSTRGILRQYKIRKAARSLTNKRLNVRPNVSVISRACFISARPFRFRSWMRLPQLFEQWDNPMRCWLQCCNGFFCRALSNGQPTESRHIQVPPQPRPPPMLRNGGSGGPAAQLFGDSSIMG